MCRNCRVFCVGVGVGEQKLLTLEAEECIEESDLIIGAARMVELYADRERPQLIEYRPDRIRDFLMEHPEYEKCAVLFSGDTGFYSGAKALVKVLEESGIMVQILPGISSVVYLAARLHTSWEDAAICSIHGRKQNFIQAVRENRKTFLILGKDSGALICEKLAYYGLQNVKLYIGNRLSYAEEEILTVQAADVKPEDFAELSVVLIENQEPSQRVCVHLPDEAFIRGKVPMTKEEVRTLSLANLRLTRDAVLYDIGAGTGSVSVEAALQAPGIRVYAVEKKEEGIELIHANKQKFMTDNLEVIHGVAPQALEGLEMPTHVFIGGSSGNLKEILRCVRRKNPNVRIVINAISLETLKEVMEAAEEGLLQEPEIRQIVASRSRKLGDYHMMMGMNPVYIVSDGRIDG
ncbi:MAG: precorrin-6y C5,15-methyltransferase (decarboxylating) subunit CbiE [Bariatricus sp.]